MTHVLATITDLQWTLLIQAGGVLFSAGILVATVRYLGKEVSDLKKSDKKHGEDIAALKVHTHYHG